jgi:hypothetical protein
VPKRPGARGAGRHGGGDARRTGRQITAEATSLLTLEDEDVRAAIRDHGGALAALIA